MPSKADELFRDAFAKPRDPRSDAYKEGVLRALRMRFREIGTFGDPPYRPGTAECDAYFAGAEEGHRLANEYEAEQERALR